MRKFLSVVLTLAFVLSTLALCIVPAAAADVEVGKVEAGYTPEKGAVAITSGEEFAAMDPNGNYYLANDITVSASYDTFKGTFDGCGYTITTTVALFRYLDNATVMNLTIGKEGDKIVAPKFSTLPIGADNKFFCAALACVANGNIVIKNVCNNTGVEDQITSEIRLAGLVGSTTAPSYLHFEDVVNNGDVNCMGYAGGIYGWCTETNLKVRFINCVNNGDVVCDQTSSGIYAGGIAARFGTDAEAKDADTPYTANTDIVLEGCVNTGDVFAYTSATGILDYTAGSATLIDCVNYGNCDAVEAAQGIFGRTGGKRNALITVIGCVNYGNMTADVETASGIVGAVGEDTYVVADKCINYGNVSVAASIWDGVHSTLAGGIVSCAYGFRNNKKSQIHYDARHSEYNVYITNCVNNGHIVAGTVGGIVGMSGHYKDTSKYEGSAYIAHCANFGTLETNVKTTDVDATGVGVVSGILGYQRFKTAGQHYELIGNFVGGKLINNQKAYPQMAGVLGMFHAASAESQAQSVMTGNIIAAEFVKGCEGSRVSLTGADLGKNISAIAWLDSSNTPAGVKDNTVLDCATGYNGYYGSEHGWRDAQIASTTASADILTTGEFVYNFNAAAGTSVLYQDLATGEIQFTPVVDPRNPDGVALNDVVFDGTSYSNPAPAGSTADAPVYFENQEDGIYGVVDAVAAGESIFVAGRVGGMIANIKTAAGVTVTVNGETFTADANGVITFEVPRSMYPMMPVVLEVVNATGAAVDVDYEFTFKPGTDMSCPIALDAVGTTTADLAVGENMYYTFVASGKGTVKVTLDANTAGQVWNDTTFVYADIDANNVAEVEVRKGQVVMINVGTANWDAGTVSFTVEFEAFGTSSTGDSLAIVLAVLAVSAVALVTVAVLPKKRRER